VTSVEIDDVTLAIRHGAAQPCHGP
jgi:hypothetical protein